MSIHLQYANLAKSLGAIAIYPMQETSGTVVSDLSGNNFNGTLTGTGITLDTDTNLLYTNYEFTGFGYINLGTTNAYLGQPNPNFIINDSFVKASGWVTAWVTANSPNTGGGMIAYWNNIGVSVDNSGNIIFFQPNENFNQQPPVNVSVIRTKIMDGNKHFLCLEVSKSAIINSSGIYSDFANLIVTIYLDNIQIFSGNVAEVYMPVNRFTGNGLQTTFYNMVADTSSIGAYKDGTNPFIGKLNNVGLFPFTLTQTQIQQLFLLGTAPYSSADIAEVISTFPIESIITNDTNSAILNTKKLIITDEFLPFNIIESLRLDYLQILENTNICPLPLAPIILPLGFIQQPVTNNLTTGNYFKVPIDNTRTIQNQIVPKYFESFIFPIETFVYPSNSINEGLMIVKSPSELTISLPFDVIILSETDVLNDLSTYTQEIFAL